MNVLFATSEAYPLAKAGGLADISYALPKALKKLGVDVRIIMPKYGNIFFNYGNKIKHLGSFTVSVGWRRQYCGIDLTEYNGIQYYLVDNEYYFKRPGYYGYYDDGERFAFFNRAVLEMLNFLDDFKPDIIHCNDWETALIPVLLKAHYGGSSNHNEIKTVFTIHNLRYQGVFGREILGDLLSLDDYYFDENRLKYYDGVSFMKGGIIYSDWVTTVSKSYAEEIKIPFYGEGLHGLLQSIGYKLSGIVNGIDYDIYDPKTDEHIYSNYDVSELNKKVKNKLKLQEELLLSVNEKIPMIGMVSRLTNQKGIDLVLAVIEDILKMEVQLVILGFGERYYEDLLRYYSAIYPAKISTNIYCSESMARKIYAASDMLLMPSLFEPCGISQQIAQRYGCLPIVRETGGLKDTVEPYNHYTGKGTGFSFTNYNAHEMLHIIKYALSVYNDEKTWHKLMEQAMNRNNSWDNSANEYKMLYKKLLK
ncbi:MAG: glycogen synthase GlgA [Thermoanaerobacteraceae bacterium]|nr:glycogen synthase GlgA [Thermoanaerobacteraceae bacterium]